MYIYSIQKILKKETTMLQLGSASAQPWMLTGQNISYAMKTSSFMRYMHKTISSEPLLFESPRQFVHIYNDAVHAEQYEDTNEVAKILKDKFGQCDLEQTTSKIKKILKEKMTPSLSQYIDYINAYKYTGGYYSVSRQRILLGLEYFLYQNDQNAIYSLLDEGMRQGADKINYSCMKGLYNRIIAQIKLTDSSLGETESDVKNYVDHLFRHYEDGDHHKALITAMWQVMVDSYSPKSEEDYLFYGQKMTLGGILEQLKTAARCLDNNASPSVFGAWAKKKGHSLDFNLSTMIDDYLGKDVSFRDGELINTHNGQTSKLGIDGIKSCLMTNLKISSDGTESCLSEVLESCKKLIKDGNVNALNKCLDQNIIVSGLENQYIRVGEKFLTTDTDINKFLIDRLLSICKTDMYKDNKSITALELCTKLDDGKAKDLLNYYREHKTYELMNIFLKDSLGSDAKIYRGEILLGKKRPDDDELKKRVLFNLCMDQSNKVHIKKLRYNDEDVQLDEHGNRWYEAKYKNQVDKIFQDILNVSKGREEQSQLWQDWLNGRAETDKKFDETLTRSNPNQAKRIRMKTFFAKYMDGVNFDPNTKKFISGDDELSEVDVKKAIVSRLMESSKGELKRALEALKLGQDVDLPNGFDSYETGEEVLRFVNEDLVNEVCDDYLSGSNTIYEVATKLKMSLDELRCVLQTKDGVTGLLESTRSHIELNRTIMPREDFVASVEGLVQERKDYASKMIETRNKLDELCVLENIDTHGSKLTENSLYTNAVENAIKEKKPDAYLSYAPIIVHTIINDDMKSFKALIELGANLNAEDKWGTNLMMVAANCGQTEMFTMLFDKYKERRDSVFRFVMTNQLRQTDSFGRDVLMHACASGNTAILDMILPKLNKNDINFISSTTHQSALYLAVINNHTGIVEKLLEKGADPLQYINILKRNNAFSEAIKYKRHDMLKLFVDNVDKKSKSRLGFFDFMAGLIGSDNIARHMRGWRRHTAKRAIFRKEFTSEVLNIMYPQGLYSEGGDGEELEKYALRADNFGVLDILLKQKKEVGGVLKNYDDKLKTSFLFTECGAIALKYADLNNNEFREIAYKIKRTSNFHYSVFLKLIEKSANIPQLDMCLGVCRSLFRNELYPIFEKFKKLIKDNIPFDEPDLIRLLNTLENAGYDAVKAYLSEMSRGNRDVPRSIIDSISSESIIKHGKLYEMQYLINLRRQFTDKDLQYACNEKLPNPDVIQKLLDHVNLDDAQKNTYINNISLEDLIRKGEFDKVRVLIGLGRQFTDKDLLNVCTLTEALNAESLGGLLKATQPKVEQVARVICNPSTNRESLITLIQYIIDKDKEYNFSTRVVVENEASDSILKKACRYGLSEQVVLMCACLKDRDGLTPSDQADCLCRAFEGGCNVFAVEALFKCNENFQCCDDDIIKSALRGHSRMAAFQCFLNYVKFPLSDDIFDELKKSSLLEGSSLNRDFLCELVKKSLEKGEGLFGDKEKTNEFVYLTLTTGSSAIFKDTNRLNIFEILAENYDKFGITKKDFSSIIERFIDNADGHMFGGDTPKIFSLIKDKVNKKTYNDLLNNEHFIRGIVRFTPDFSKIAESLSPFSQKMVKEIMQYAIHKGFFLYYDSEPEKVWKILFKDIKDTGFKAYIGCLETILDIAYSIQVTPSLGYLRNSLAMIKALNLSDITEIDQSCFKTFMTNILTKVEIDIVKALVDRVCESNKIFSLQSVFENKEDDSYLEIVNHTLDKCKNLGIIFSAFGTRGIDALMAENGLLKMEGGSLILGDKDCKWSHDDQKEYLQALYLKDQDAYVKMINVLNFRMKDMVFEGENRLHKLHIISNLSEKLKSGLDESTDKEKLIAKACYDRLKEIMGTCIEDFTSQTQKPFATLDKFFKNEEVSKKELADSFKEIADVINKVSDKIKPQELETVWSRFTYCMYQVCSAYGIFPNKTAESWRESYNKIIEIEKQKRDDEMTLINRELKSFGQENSPDETVVNKIIAKMPPSTPKYVSSAFSILFAVGLKIISGPMKPE